MSTRVYPGAARLLCLGALMTLLAAPAAAADGSRFDGLWCGTGLLQEFSLKLKHGDAAHIQGLLMRRDRAREIGGSVSGNVLKAQTPNNGTVVLEAVGGELRLAGGEGVLALARGVSFRRATGASCGA